MRGHFDLLIADDVHELKGKGSARGLAGAALAEACAKTLVLTGTLLGGYASTLFHLLYRFSLFVRAEFAHSDEAKWVARADDGRRSKRRTYPMREAEVPREPTPFPVRSAPDAPGQLGDLLLFATDPAASAPANTAQNGKVVKFEELGQLLQLRKARRKRVPEGQLTLFSS
ncbi:MAG: hypothetical protein AB7U18_20675 [Dehalococcoidia bacterium]